MDTTDYRLPNGRIVAVDASAAKGAALIDFTLQGGRIVQAIRADIPFPSYETRRRLIESTRADILMPKENG